jgi:tetratricopeptide (TPR) repeat protein
MGVSKQLWFLQPTDSRLRQILVPLMSAGAMLCSSFLVWLKDPLGQMYSAWSLPVDIGWQIRLNAFSYGLLCLCCAVYASLVACANWKSFRWDSFFLHRYLFASFMCLVPVILFLLQYLCVDVHGMDLLAQHKIQARLISDHFGYGTPGDLVQVKPFSLDISTVAGRAGLLVDQLGLGALLPVLSALALLDCRRLFPRPPRSSSRRAKYRRPALALACLIGAALLLRSPVGLVCEYEANAALSSGQYAQALTWLGAAKSFNPDLDQVAYYHREIGQATYFLHPDQQLADSRIYLAYAYRQQGDYLDAYQELLGLWQLDPRVPWVVSEMSVTLEGLAEFVHPLRGPLVRKPINDDSSLPWVLSLIQVDDSNIYGHYLVGRIDYDLHNYAACLSQMTAVLHFSSDMDERSSAYTYMGLSEIGLGNEETGRDLLFEAVTLDPDYRNNSAREELSGLR